MSLAAILKGLWASMTSSKGVIGGVTVEKAEDLIFLNLTY
jgi:vacuolar-type H+-ATPase subunit E/Vma4